MTPILRRPAGLAFGAAVVLVGFVAGVALGHVLAPAVEALFEHLWGR